MEREWLTLKERQVTKKVKGEYMHKLKIDSTKRSKCMNMILMSLYRLHSRALAKYAVCGVNAFKRCQICNVSLHNLDT